MLLSIQSIEDKNSTEKYKTYSRIRTNVNIPWECNYIKYHVSSLNTKANILITTKDDDIIELNNEPSLTIKFDDCFSLSEKAMLNYFSCINNFTVKIVNRRLVINSNFDFMFTKLTHRARLVTGLLNAELNKTYEAGKDHVFDIPILDYGNKLYLISKQGQGIQSNIGNKEYTPSVIGNIDLTIIDEAPLIIKFETYGRPIENVVNVDSFGMIELELVDFMYQPIILCSPMFVTIKIEPYKVPSIDYVHM